VQPSKEIPAEAEFLKRVSAQPLPSATPSTWSERSDRSGEAPTEEEEASRRAQLQVVVKTFVLRALSGVYCHVLDLEANISRPAVYKLDKSLRRLSVQVEDVTGVGEEEVIIDWSTDMKDISQVRVGINSARRGGSIDPAVLQAAFMESLSALERRALVLLECSDSKRLVILEQDARHAEDFRIAIGILSMYGRDQKPSQASKASPTEMRSPLGANLVLSGPAQKVRPLLEASADPEDATCEMSAPAASTDPSARLTWKLTTSDAADPPGQPPSLPGKKEREIPHWYIGEPPEPPGDADCETPGDEIAPTGSAEADFRELTQDLVSEDGDETKEPLRQLVV
jgi:hypothetical protein